MGATRPLSGGADTRRKPPERSRTRPRYRTSLPPMLSRELTLGRARLVRRRRRRGWPQSGTTGRRGDPGTTYERRRASHATPRNGCCCGPSSWADGELLSSFLQATGTDYVQDKVFDRDFRVILNCQSESSRIRRIPIEYVLEIPCIMHDASNRCPSAGTVPPSAIGDGIAPRRQAGRCGRFRAHLLPLHPAPAFDAVAAALAAAIAALRVKLWGRGACASASSLHRRQ